MGGNVLALDKSIGEKLEKSDIALMARELVLVTLPHKDPGNIPVWSRQNGNIGLLIQPGFSKRKAGEKPVCFGYPYGSIARLILYWIVTETRRTGQQRLELGNSLSQFLRKVGLSPDGSTGKRSTAKAVHRQLVRLIYAKITFERFTEEGTNNGRQWLDMPLAKGGHLWWDQDDTEQENLLGSFIILNDDFFKAIMTNPVPVRMMTLLALRKSPLGLDLYAWATFESYKAQAKKQGRFVAWKLLHEQFGTELGTVYNFAAKARRELRKIMCNCPGIKLSFRQGGVQIHAESLPDVSIKEEREALKLPPFTLPANQEIPSGEAIAQAVTMNPKEGAIALVIKFQEAVKQGRAENNDTAYISFVKQHLESE
jgi:hypothetical protein